MMDTHRFVQAFNAQLAVDDGAQVVVPHGVTRAPGGGRRPRSRRPASPKTRLRNRTSPDHAGAWRRRRAPADALCRPSPALSATPRPLP